MSEFMDKKYSVPEKRRLKRAKANFIVTYQVDKPLDLRTFIKDREAYALMVDLSESGMCIETKEDIPVATLLLIKFILFDYTVKRKENQVKSIEVEGEVCYNILLKNNKYRTVISFRQIDEEARRVIAKFVEKVAK